VKKKYLIPFFLIIGYWSLVIGHLHAALAQEMSSQNFEIQGGNFNMTSGNKTSTNFRLSDVVGQNASITFASKGYVIQSGFLNTAAASIFSFSVYPQTIDFGILTADTPVIKQATIKIANGEVPGYVIKVLQNQPLSTTLNASIPDTICDAGTSCTPKKANQWNKLTTYGFGYRMDGKTASKDFTKDNFFRAFAASTRNEDPVIIMETKARKVVDTATMTLKVNVNRSQPVGIYRNVLTFIALAGI
jgi:hypothetical protein